MKNINFLDCTLRDGGYYINWDFDYNAALELINSLQNAGVDIIELGYKSTEKNDFYGSFKYCNEKFLEDINTDGKSVFAFMFDVKEVIENGIINYEKLNEVIPFQNESIFKWVRLATYYSTVNEVPDLINYFKKRGYNIAVNLMGGSLLSKEQIKTALIMFDGKIDVFYLADSFGSYYPADIKDLIQFCKTYYKGPIGIHTHDNQGMAFANTLVAIESGVKYVDGTITGMGRGAGNLVTEQFLLAANQKFGLDYYPSSLLPIINDYFLPLKKEHGWGYNYAYMFSGINNIHPTYCQFLLTGNKFSTKKMEEILSEIPKRNRSKFNKEIIEEAINKALESDTLNKSFSKIPLLNNFTINSNTCLIVSTGSNTIRYANDIQKYIKYKDVDVIECNDSTILDTFDRREILVLNEMRLNEILSQKDNYARVITGATRIQDAYKDYPVNRIPVNLSDNIEFSIEKMSILAYEAGQFAINYAISKGYKNIFIAGFDGYDNVALNTVMDDFFLEIQDYLKEHKIFLRSVLPTSYENIDKTSIYAL